MTSTPDAFHDRSQAAFLGLALGDAYGRPLEFISSESVRTFPVEISADEFMWTDDTHMALYLAKAILDCPEIDLTSDQFGSAVAKQFVAWSHDPLTPSTAPGNTCLEGVRRFEHGGNWQKSGLLDSDGCGGVMRICPLAMAFTGQALTDAARISAVVTHRHPNAIDAAITASHMLRDILETGVFNFATVGRTLGLINPDCMVSQALNAAIEESKSPAKWLNEEAIPAGDGGWRSASALGLAAAAALKWDGNFEKVVDRAARIHGDSDSVACLAGMLTAAAHGIQCLPESWLNVLPERAQIEQVADRLTRRKIVREFEKNGGEEWSK